MKEVDAYRESLLVMQKLDTVFNEIEEEHKEKTKDLREEMARCSEHRQNCYVLLREALLRGEQ